MAITYNNVPTTGSWGASADVTNDNFLKTGTELARIDESISNITNRFKGYFPTLPALQTAFPLPKIGDTAWVGTPYPGYIYICEVAGAWKATTQVPSTGNTPYIGENGNWWISGTDTGQPSRGQDGTNIAYKTIYNVSQANSNYAYTTKALARAAVTSTLRALGQIITYKLTTGWVTEQYIGADVNGWAAESNWQVVVYSKDGKINGLKPNPSLGNAFNKRYLFWGDQNSFVTEFPELDNGILSNENYSVNNIGEPLIFENYNNEITGFAYNKKIVSKTKTNQTYAYAIESAKSIVSFGVWIRKSEYSNVLAIHFYSFNNKIPSESEIRYLNIRINANNIGEIASHTTTNHVASVEIERQVDGWLFVRGSFRSLNQNRTGVILFDAVGDTVGVSSNYGYGGGAIGKQPSTKSYTHIGWHLSSDYTNIVPDQDNGFARDVLMCEEIDFSKETPVIALEDIYTYVGDTLQLFKASFLLCSDYRKYDINAYLLESKTILDVFPRYVEFKPIVKGTWTLTVDVYNDSMYRVATKTVRLHVGEKKAPTTKKNILFIGDSLTQSGNNNISGLPPTNPPATQYTTDEVNRILTSTDVATSTSPAGCAFNIQLIGSKTAGGGSKHEGNGGYSWQSYLNAGSPFLVGNNFDILTYLAKNSIYPDSTKKGVDLIYIGLGLNDIEFVTEDYSGSTPKFDVSYPISLARFFLDRVNEQIRQGTGVYANPNLKVVLWLEPFAGHDGGLTYHPWAMKQGWSPLLHNRLRHAIYQATVDLAKESDLKDWVSICCASPQLDVENVYLYHMKPINKRMTSTEKITLEDVHPDGNGYLQLGEALSRDVIYRLSE